MSAVRTPAPEMISLREFARRDGCDEKLVRNAIRDGHLPRLVDKKLGAALVGSGWRLSNRRGADTPATKVRTPAKNLRTVRTEVSANSAPVADVETLAAVASGVAFDAAVLLLPLLPRVVLEPLLAELVSRTRYSATSQLHEEGIASPDGVAWADHPAFAGSAMGDSDWAEAEAEAGQPVQTPAEAASRIVAAGRPPPLAESEARKEHYLALLRQLEYEEKVATVLPCADVETVVGTVLGAVRAGYLSLPTKAAPHMVGLSTAAAAKEKLTDLVYEVLNNLAETEVVVEQVKGNGVHRRRMKAANA